MNIFARPFVKKNENLKDEKTRQACGKRAGVTCIIINTLLAVGKIVMGALTGAVSVLADGFNNLTDCGSNVVSVIGFKMSSKPADKEHPFGHQRAESVSAMLIAVLILFVAVELITQSIEKIISPLFTKLSLWLTVILAISVLLKLFMFAVNRGLGKATDSETLLATAADSLSDSIATFTVLIALIVSHFTGVILDGYAGIAVALFIAFTGFKLLKETISNLLGKAPDVEIIKQIEERIMAFEHVHGIHDLAVHCYGQNKMYATVHVEVDSSMPIMHAHQLADTIERDFIENTNVILTVHIDPLVLDDPKVNALRELAITAVSEILPVGKIHDFRVVGGKTKFNLVFDVAVPFENKDSDQKIADDITASINAKDGSLGVVVTIERQNVT